MNSKLRNFLLLWSVVSVMMGCEQKGTLKKTIKSKTVLGTLGNKTDPSTDPSNKQSAAVATPEDTSSKIPFSISALSVPSGSCNSAYLSYSSSNALIVATKDAVTWAGIWPNCSAEISPEPNSNGTTNIEITAHDEGISIIVKSIKFISEPVNDAPIITYISSPQITNEDKALAVAFTADDVDGDLTCTSAHLLYFSDAPSVVAESGAVSWGGTWPNCTGTINPVANASGSANIIFTISDGALATSRSFTFVATAVNDAPLISDVANQSMNEDNTLNNLAVSISDVDNSLACATVLSAVSSNTALLPSAYIIIGGTAPNCTVSLNPVFNQNGTTTVNLTVTDGLLSSQDTFVLTVNAVNDAPTISNVADQITNEDLALNGLAVTISDVDNSLVCATAISATSSNTTLLPSANITIAGTAPNCTVSLNLASFQNGTSTVTLTVTDGQLSSQDTFVLTVNPVNNGPSISDVLNQSTTQDTVLNGVPVTITDIDSALTCSNITALSSNTTVILSASITISGTAPNCLVSLSPAAGQIGTSSITLTVSDGALTASDTFLFTVTKAGWNQEAYLKASNAETSDSYGRSVAVSGDTVLIGANGESSSQTTITNGTTSSVDNSALNAGASYIYKRTGSTWIQEAYLKASNSNASDYFGGAASLSGDTAVIGVRGEGSNQTTITNGSGSSTDNSAINAGASYIYKRTGSIWAQEAYLKASNANASDNFGYSVAISGNTAAIGAFQEGSSQTAITNGTTSSTDNSAFSAGACYIYVRAGPTWAQEAYLKASNANAYDNFGYSVAISGNTAVIGAYQESSNQITITNGTTSSTDNSTSASGASYIYKRTGSTWIQEAYLKASNSNTADNFGSSVALSGDTVVVGAFWESSNEITITNGTTSSSDNSASGAGASYIYKRTGSTWAQEAYLKASNSNAFDRLFSVAVSGDTAVVGAYREGSNQTTITNGTTSSTDNSANSSGASYIYRRAGSTWAQEAYLKASNSNASDEFGYSVALSGDTAVIEAIGEDSNQTTITNGTTSSTDNSASNAGAVYVYRNLSRMFEAHEIQSSVTSSSFTVSWNGSNLGSGNGTFKVVYSTSTPGANCSSGTVAYNGTSTSVSVSSGLTPGQSYIVRICTFNGVNYSEGTTTQVTVKGDDVGPNVLSINRGSTSNPVSGTSLVDYIVTFNEPVMGVSPDNFSFTEVTSTTGATGKVSNISCSGSVCTVWVLPGNAGQLRLDLTNVTGIVDVWGNPLTAGKTGDETYTLKGWAQEAYLKASNAEANDWFGYAVALSGDKAVSGAYQESSNQTTITNGTTSSVDNSSGASGATFIYKRTGSTWVQEAYLKASNSNASGYFGYFVAISEDTVIVGALGEGSNQNTITNGTTSSTNNSVFSAGAAYVYKRTGSTWVQEAYLKPPYPEGSDYYTYSIAISGNTAVIGSLTEDSNQTTITNGTTASSNNSSMNAGASYIYKRTGSTWAQEAYLKASNNNASAPSYFGASVALSGDTVVVGAYIESSNQTTITNGTTSSSDISTSQSGASFIYKKTGSTWAQEAYLKASNTNAFDDFGYSVAISGDTIIVGAIGEGSNQSTITNGTTSSSDNSVGIAGAGYIYKRTGIIWAQEAYLKASNPTANDNLGSSVDISGDTAVMGAFREDANQTMINNGTTSNADNSAMDAGASYIFKRTGSTWSQEAYLKASNIEANDKFGYSVALSADTVLVGAYQESSNQSTITNGPTSSTNNSVNRAGAAYVYRNLSRLFDPDVRVSAKSTTSVTLSWGSNLGTTTQVKISPAVLGSANPLPCTDGGAITLGAGVTSYTYSGLTTATTYSFRVCGFDGTNVSDGAIIRDNTN